MNARCNEAFIPIEQERKNSLNFALIDPIGRLMRKLSPSTQLSLPKLICTLGDNTGLDKPRLAAEC